jgi:RNA polymerase sigma-70 factor (ECF subfamily)
LTSTSLRGQRLSDDAPADIGLLARVVGRDANALEELYDRHGRVLFGLILRILGDRAEAEEVLQEVFVLVWTRAGTYDVSLGSPIGWLVGIARNRAIDRLRALATRLKAAEAVPPPPAVTSPEVQAAHRERQQIVARALDCLPANQRELIEQAYFLGLSHSELALRFSLPVGTVKTRIRQGMISLRQQLHDADGIR